MKPSQPAAAKAVTRLDRFVLRPLGVDDFAIVEPVLARVPAEVFSVPRLEEGFRSFVGRISRVPWTLPCICFAEGNPAAVFFLIVPEYRHLNAYLVALMGIPGDALPALGLYARHAFWSYPLHRLYSHVPALPAAAAYVDAFTTAGFTNEGRLVDHVMTDQGPADAVVVGLLRDEFSKWCEMREPRLSLQ